MQENLTDLLLMLLDEGSTNDAIELYREETGTSREEACQFIHNLSRRHGVRPRSSGWLSLALLTGATLLGIFLSM